MQFPTQMCPKVWGTWPRQEFMKLANSCHCGQKWAMKSLHSLHQDWSPENDMPPCFLCFEFCSAWGRRGRCYSRSVVAVTSNLKVVEQSWDFGCWNGVFWKFSAKLGKRSDADTGCELQRYGNMKRAL